MSDHPRSPPNQRFRGASAARSPMSDAERRRVLAQLERVRERIEAEAPQPADATPPRAVPRQERATVERTATRAAEHQAASGTAEGDDARPVTSPPVVMQRERGTDDPGLASVPRVIWVHPPVRPSATGTPSRSTPVRTRHPAGVDPELGQRVDHTIGPDLLSQRQPPVRMPAAPNPPASARRVLVSTQDALDELNSDYFRRLWNAKAQQLSSRARSRHDAPLRRLRSRFERLMGQHPEGISTRRAWEEARGVFDDAYEHARSRWSSSSMWTAVWADDAATQRLEALERRGVVRIPRTTAGRPSGALQIRAFDQRTGQYSWVPVNIDHAVPLERNPWGVLGHDNLVATTPHINQRFLNGFSAHSQFPMAVDRFGGAQGQLDDAIEDFVMANGLSRRQRATAAQLDARYGPRHRPGRSSRRSGADAGEQSERGRRPRTSESGQRAIRGLLPAFSWALEMIFGAGRRQFYQHAVEELRRQERARRERDVRFTDLSALPQNVVQTFDRVVGDRHPVTVRQAGELRQRFQRWLEGWERPAGERWRIQDIIVNHALIAATPRQRDNILNNLMVEVIDNRRALQQLIARIDARLGEQNWAERAAVAAEAADNYDGVLEGEIQQFALDPDDAEYLSRASVRRVAVALHNFHEQLVQLRGLALDAANRYARLLELITPLTQQ